MSVRSYIRRMHTLGDDGHVPPANDNALASYLDSEPAQHTSLITLLGVVRLAKCPLKFGGLSAAQLALMAGIIESA